MDGGQEEVTTFSKDNSDRSSEGLSYIHVQSEKSRLLLKMNDRWSLVPEEECGTFLRKFACYLSVNLALHHRNFESSASLWELQMLQ
jgi:hypothetical protein